jgi:hypothetical protein
VDQVTDADEPIYRRGEELLRDPMWLEANTGWGSHRLSYPAIQSSELTARLLRMPAGQRSPWHGSAGWPELGAPFPPVGDGCIFFNVEGEVEFFAGGSSFLMKPCDMLLINAVVYSYQNPGFSDVLFWTLQPNRSATMESISKAPHAGHVWQGDPLATRMIGSHPYYDSEPSHSLEDLDRISVIHWDDYRRAEIAWHGEWGSHWGTYPLLGAEVQGRMIRVPAGQRVQRNELPHEVLFLGTRYGSLDFHIERSVCPLGIRDALVVPAKQSFKCVNVGSDEALVFEVWPRGQGLDSLPPDEGS